MEHDATSSAGQTPQVAIVEEQARAIMQAVPDLVFLLGLDGRYIDIFSARDEDLFIPREELIGKTVSDVLPPPVGTDCLDAINQLSGPADVTSFSYSLEIAGQPRWFEGRVTLCGESSVLVLVRDFTEQRLAEDALGKANKDLELHAGQLQRLGRELTIVEQRERQRMAHVLHDSLQQLLVGAKFSLAILTKKANSSKEIAAAEQVSSVLDEAIRQSQALTVDLCPPILYEGSLTQSLQWIVTQMAERHGLAVALDVGTPIPGEIVEDIRMVLFNAVKEILFNVVKHAGVKTASVDVSLPEQDRLRISVSDKGSGFDVDAVRERSDVGGFGLFAIHERISALGGALEMESSPGHGTRVSLTVPLEAVLDDPVALEPEGSVASPAQPAAPVVSNSADASSEASIRVLLVDDHPVMRQGMTQLLQDEVGMTVIGEASDGGMAIDMVRRTQPNVVLMDVSMPGMNGVEATRRIHAEFPAVNVIGLSMYDESERAAEMLSAGAIGYVAKSDAVEHVIGAIHSAMSRPAS